MHRNGAGDDSDVGLIEVAGVALMAIVAASFPSQIGFFFLFFGRLLCALIRCSSRWRFSPVLLTPSLLPVNQI